MVCLFRACKKAERPVKAASLCGAAAYGGGAVGQWRLGTLSEKGKCVDPDYTEAVRWYAPAARHGYPIAQPSLGWRYVGGAPVQQSEDRAQ